MVNQAIDELRKAVINLIYKIALRCSNDNNVKYYATKFENELFELLSFSDYLRKIANISSIIQVQYGYFPDEIIFLKYMDNSLTLLEILNYNINISSRDRIIRLFISIIFKEYKLLLSHKEILKIAKTIEKSCYNHIILQCKNLEDPPCRKWTSSVFLTMYSNKCGVIYNLLNYNSSSNRLYNSTLLENIINNKINIKEIGSKSEKELCPKSIELEKKQIELRSEQHVKEKESNLFRCPKCKERRVTYREVQLRSIDEAPDYSCKCLNCGSRFKGKY